MARDHGISRATGYRHLGEIIEVLAERAPDLQQALEKAKADGLAYAHEHDGNIQALTEPDGFPLWVADVEPGSVYDLTVATCSAPCTGPLPVPTSRLWPTAATKRWDRRTHPDQTTCRRPGPRRGRPHLQHAPTWPTLPGRTWVRRPHRPLPHLQHITASPSKTATTSRPHSSPPTSNTADSPESW